MRFPAIKKMIALIFLMACVEFSIAGEGGYVYLINLSGSDWKVTHRGSRAMSDWKFPNYLKNGDTARVYVEFRRFSKSVKGRVDYELVGTRGNSFQIFAYGKPRRLEAVYNNLEIDGQPKGTKRGLGWRHNGDTNFIIIGKNGKYTGTSLDGSNWMKNNIQVLGRRTLRQICIPGSHEAGMSRLDGHTAIGRECNAITQSHSIRQQLDLGMRYFDIRPVIGNGGKYLTGHYSHIKGSWQGGNGQSIASIISDLNDFTKNHKELIVIYFSHPLNTDVSSNSYRKFKQEEWEKLFQKLDTINYLYNNDNSDVNLEKITLNDYTHKGSRASVVIIVDDPDSKVQLGSRKGKGYFTPVSLDIYESHAGTNKWSKMVKDQIEKMHEKSNHQYFLLSWTLAQSDFQAFICRPSVKDLANQANICLGSFLYKEVSSSSFPNIILVDNVRDTDVAAMALAITSKVML